MNTCNKNLHNISRCSASISESKETELNEYQAKKDGFLGHQKRIQYDWPLYLSHLNNVKFLEYKVHKKHNFIKLDRTTSLMVDDK